MDTQKSPAANVNAPTKRTFATTLVGVSCLLFGGVILLSSINSLFGITPSPTNPQSSAEALGGKIGVLLIGAAGFYVALYGLKKLRKRTG